MSNKCLRSAFSIVTIFAFATVGTAEAAELNFKFHFKTSDGDIFRLNLTTEDTLTTQSFSSFIDPAWDPDKHLLSPAYTFTGYRVLSVSGTETERNPDDPSNPIINTVHDILPTGTSISAFIDTIAHSPTDNLFNPDGGFVSPTIPRFDPSDSFPDDNPALWFGQVSFGGLALSVDVGNGVYESYQVFTDPTGGPGSPNYGKYAGCPGSCVKVVPVPEPLTLLGASTAIAFGAGFKRRKNQG